MIKNRVLIALTAALALVSGCVTTAPKPEEVGAGRYLQVRTLGKNLVAQSRYRSSIDCEMNLRQSWSQSVSENLVPRCSSEDVSDELPYWIRLVKSDFVMAPITINFASSELCDATLRTIENSGSKYGNAKLENHCADSSKNALRNDQGLSVDGKLSELRRLFDAGLITKDVYVERQKELLK